MNIINRHTEIKKIISKYGLNDFDKLLAYIESNPDEVDWNTLSMIAELSNSNRVENAAHYTSDIVCMQLTSSLPDIQDKDLIRILEPSVGAGNFIPHIINKYKKVKKLHIDVIDVNLNSLQILKILLSKIKISKNIKINYIHADFLKYPVSEKYDIVIGNPPFMKVKDKNLLVEYKKGIKNLKTTNIASYFLEKSISISNHISLILPKSIINAPEFNNTRELMQAFTLDAIHDFGEKAFQGVKIETVGISLTIKKPSLNHKLLIHSHLRQSSTLLKQSYVCCTDYPYWLIYRDKFFDTVSATLKLGIFTAYRDRQITKKHTQKYGSIRVLKSRNISSNGIINIPGYDSYIDDVDSFSIRKFMNNKSAVLVPNLTYSPRACLMPENSITDGSVAVLVLKEKFRIKKSDLEYFSSDEFIKYYSIARNLGTRSLNIDSNSVFFFGVKREFK